MYTFWLVVHVLSILVLAGPVFALPYLQAAFPEPGVGQLKVAHFIARGLAIFLVVQLVTGAALMLAGDAAAIGRAPWFSVSMLLFFALGAVGTGFNGVRVRKALKAAEAGDLAAVPKLMEPVNKITGPAASLLLAAILLLMVWQPGA